MSSSSYSVLAGSSEVVPVLIVTAADPTAGDLPSFGFVAEGTTGEPTVWTDGTWGTWTAGTSTAVALSPLVPGPDAEVELARGRWRVFVRFGVGTEDPLEAPGLLSVL